MSDLIVMTFDDVSEASNVRDSVKQLEQRHLLKLDDSVVVTKDATGKIRVRNQPSGGAITGGAAGSVIGLLLSFMFPVIGVVFGAVAGAFLGRSLDDQVDRQFVSDVESALKPGTSALFLLARARDFTPLLAELRHSHGQVYQTTLSSEVEEALRQSPQ